MGTRGLVQDAGPLYLRADPGGALMGKLDQTDTGRRMARGFCPSCQMRFKVGEPKAQDSWPAQLSVNARQMDLLLVAAAEFKELCDEAGEYDDAISFLDWVRVDALSRTFESPVNVQREAVSAAAKVAR